MEVLGGENANQPRGSTTTIGKDDDVLSRFSISTHNAVGSNAGKVRGRDTLLFSLPHAARLEVEPGWRVWECST